MDKPDWGDPDPTYIPDSDLVAEMEATALNDLPEVVWDRCAGTDANRVVFGWLPRRDGDRDFVAILFETGTDGMYYQLLTSSAKYSAEFAHRLGLSHDDCITVDRWYGDRVIRRLIHDPDAEPETEIGGAPV